MGARSVAGVPVRSRLRRVLVLGLALVLPVGVVGAAPASAEPAHAAAAAAAADPAGTDRPPPRRGRPAASGGPDPAGSVGARAAGSGTDGQPVVPGAAHPRLPARAVAATGRVGPLRTGHWGAAGCAAGAAHPRRGRCTGRPCTAAAGRWCSTHPASAAPATAAPSWSRNWSAADTSWSPSITPTTPARSSSPTGASRRRRYRRSRPRSSNRRSRCGSPTPASSSTRSTALNAGTQPGRRAPQTSRRATRRAATVQRGMFGHSLGGATAAAAMLEDRRIKAGVNLDGTLFGPVVNAGLDRPFMLVAAQDHGRDNDETWAKFWANLRGWRLNLQLTGSGAQLVHRLPGPGAPDSRRAQPPARRRAAADRHDRPRPVHQQSTRLPHRVLRPPPSRPRQPPARPPLTTLPGNAVRALILHRRLYANCRGHPAGSGHGRPLPRSAYAFSTSAPRDSRTRLRRSKSAGTKEKTAMS